MTYWLSAWHRDALNKEHKELIRRQRQLASQRGDRDVTRPATIETTQDGSGHDEEYQRVLTRTAEVFDLITNGQVSPEPDQTERLRIGHVVTFSYDEDDKETRVTYFVGGYQESDPLSKPHMTLSYDSPMIKPFLGKDKGSSATISVRGAKREVELVEIKLPEKGKRTPLKAVS